jgi:parallel beta-helix repeat protein
MNGAAILAFLFLFGPDNPPVTEVWDVTRTEPGRSARLQDLGNCTADMAAVLAEARMRLDGTEDTLVLYFPEGIYTFGDDETGIFIDGFTNGNLIVRGAGTQRTTLCFNAIPRVGFWVHHSNRVTVEHLHLTRPGYFASQFDVVSVDTNGAYLQIHEGFPTPEELRAYGDKWNGQEITLLPFRYVDGQPQRSPVDNKRLLHQVHGDLSVFPFTDLGDGLWYAQFRQAPRIKYPIGWSAGDQVALKIRTGQNTLRFRNSNDCVARDLLITRSCGNPIRSFFDCNRLLIERVHIARPIGGIGGRIPFFSGSDGGIQLGSGREGPTVRGCIIESTADDAIGIFSDMDEVTSGVLIEGNTVYDGQARGILITQSRNGICRSNTLIRCNSYAVGIRNGITFEGGSVTNWDLYENQFIDCLVNPVIGLTRRPDISETALHDNIRIFNNTFIGAPRNNHLVYVEVTASLNISSNVVVSFNPEEDYNDYGTGNALVYVKEGSLVTGADNVCEEPTERMVWQKVRNEDQVDVEWN